MNFIRTVLFICLFAFTSAVFADVVNINTASAQEIADALKGVGPSKAAAIVEYREKNGPFQSVEDLVQVKGIGPSTLQSNIKNISVEKQ